MSLPQGSQRKALEDDRLTLQVTFPSFWTWRMSCRSSRSSNVTLSHSATGDLGRIVGQNQNRRSSLTLCEAVRQERERSVRDVQPETAEINFGRPAHTSPTKTQLLQLRNIQGCRLRTHRRQALQPYTSRIESQQWSPGIR